MTDVALAAAGGFELNDFGTFSSAVQRRVATRGRRPRRSVHLLGHECGHSEAVEAGGLRCLYPPGVAVLLSGGDVYMDALSQSLHRLRRLGGGMSEMSAIDEALPALRRMLRDAAVPFRIIGGLAVHHHGWRRFTEDVDVVIDAAALDRLDAALGAHGFARESKSRIRHLPTGVRVDVLVSGTPLARRPEVSFPRPQDIEPSPNDPDVAGLRPLVRLKLLAGWRRDETDVVELLKRMDYGAYLELEAGLPAELRPLVAQLRDEALEELRFEQL